MPPRLAIKTTARPAVGPIRRTPIKAARAAKAARPAPTRRKVQAPAPTGATALVADAPSLVAGTPDTPSGDVAVFLTPLEQVSHGPTIPVLRYFAQAAQSEPTRTVVTDRTTIAKALGISERHVSRALSVLTSAGFLTREVTATHYHTYKVQCVILAPSATAA